MSNAALIHATHSYDFWMPSRAVRRVLRQANREVCACGRKSYRTERKARLALGAIGVNELNRQHALHQDARVERNYYECPRSGLYHLTTKE
jgi:hypothetical protein